MKDPHAVSKQLKSLLAEYADEMIVVADQDDNFYLNTPHVMKNK